MLLALPPGLSSMRPLCYGFTHAMIDLHVHTIHSSDGQYSPAEIISLAASRGVRTLAFCDHMDIRAVSEGFDAARISGIELFSGVEISTAFRGREHHLLCYGFDPRSPRISEFIEDACRGIWQGIPTIIGRFREMGFVLEESDITGWGRSVPTGVTFLNALAKRNPRDPRILRYTRGDRSGSPYLNFYQDFSRAGLGEAVSSGLPDLVQTIRDIGSCGILVLAHPGEMDRASLRELKTRGIQGIEVYSTHHGPAVTEYLAGCAASLGLLASAGSDFHGERIKPDIRLGDVPGQPDTALIEAIRKKMSAWQ